MSSGASHRERRLRLAVALTFPVYPPTGGGQARVYHLYRELARQADVELVTLGPTGTAPSCRRLAAGLTERRVPKSIEHATAEMALERQVGTVVTDVAMTRLHHLTPTFKSALRESARGADAIIASHPFAYQAIREATDVPLCYEAHNVEASLKEHVLGDGQCGRSLLADVIRAEQACVREAELVWACSTEDRDELIGRYQASPDRIVVVPNGAALDELRYVPLDLRRALRRRLRMRPCSPALFMASWHPPNVEAALRLVKLAERTPAVDYLIVGSVGSAVSSRPLPPNVQLTGVVSAAFKKTVLDIADVALNPVTSGSGTNIKMLDYLGSGTPVISTAFGARGLGIHPGVHYLRTEPGEFDSALNVLHERDPDRLGEMIRAARAHVEDRLAWSAIADALAGHLRARFNARSSKFSLVGT